MKIRGPVRAAYLEQKPIFEGLQARVDDLLQKACRQNRWHYESRVKEEASYALKLETGRVPALDDVEDFFGATIVVRNSSEIGRAVRLVREHCDIRNRRPPAPPRTHLRSSSFEFDDLRLYVVLKADNTVPPRPEDGRVFEIQIKTFLFHAWAIATHDLIYKSDSIHWGRERIAFQVRAMLEHAENSIEQAETLAANSVALGREDRHSEELSAFLQYIVATWPADQLPEDLRRLAQNIRDLLECTGISRARWQDLVTAEIGEGPPPLDENPYQLSVRLLFANEEAAVRAFAEKPNERRKIVIYETFLHPAWLMPATCPNVLLVPDG